MNWGEKVRLYYAAPLLMVAACIYSALISINSGNKMSLEIFIITFVVQVLLKYFLSKGKSPWTSVFIAMIPAVLFEIIFQGGNTTVSNLIFILFINIIYVYKFEGDINYEWNKGILIKGLAIILLLAVIESFLSIKTSSVIYRMILIYLILMIIALREILVYSNKIKKDKIFRNTNISIVFFAIMLTMDFFYQILVSLGKILSNVVSFVLGKIISLLLIILEKPFNWIYTLLSKRAGYKPIEVANNDLYAESNTDAIYQMDPKIVNMVLIVIKVVIILFIIWAAIRIIKQIRHVEIKSEELSYEETIEDINPNSEGKKKMSILHDIFRRKGTSREEVIYKYEKFASNSEEKGVFKRYMTPKQFENTIKISVDDVNDFSEVTEIYNKAKFSREEINDEMEGRTKDIVNKTSKKYKNLKKDSTQ